MLAYGSLKRGEDIAAGLYVHSRRNQYVHFAVGRGERQPLSVRRQHVSNGVNFRWVALVDLARIHPGLPERDLNLHPRLLGFADDQWEAAQPDGVVREIP